MKILNLKFLRSRLFFSKTNKYFSILYKMETLIESTIPTIKEFLFDSYLFELNNCRLLSFLPWPKDENSIALVFDKTVFHPQGGGQPSDEGVIENQEKIIQIKIEAVLHQREKDIILHKISKDTFEKYKITVGDFFHQKIDKEKRILYARLHSGGHLLDIAVSKLGLNLTPGKGYHFPDGPYVEYNGTIDKKSIPSLCEQFEKISNEIIEKSDAEDSTLVKFYDYYDGKNEFKNLPSYLPESKPFRWVKLQKEDSGCPCGGTHVKHLKDIQKLKINKITNKGKVVRISYNIV